MPIKGIIWGSVTGIVLGIATYFAILIWFVFSLGLDTATGEQVGNYMRSSTIYLLSFPLSVLLMMASGFVAANKSRSGYYIAALCISVIVCLSIRFGPLKLWSIYMNYIPVFIGTFLGVFISIQLNKSRLTDA